MTSSKKLVEELAAEIAQAYDDYSQWEHKRVKIAAVRTSSALTRIKRLAVAAKQAMLDERKAYVAEQSNDKRRLAR